MDAAAVVEELGRTSQGLVTAARLVDAGVPRPALSRAVKAGSVLRLRRGVYALGKLPARPAFVVTDRGVAPEFVAQVRAVLLSMGAGTAACGRTAAALYGWGMLVEPAVVEVAVPHGSGPRPGRRTATWSRVQRVQARQRRSAARARVRVLPGTDRLRLTTALQTVVDCALDRPLLEAVVICDSALRARAVTTEEVLRAAARMPGVRGAARVRKVVAMCDPLSGSVLESVLRVRLLLAGLDGFSTQAVLVATPQLRVDFCFLSAGLVVEVDGAR